MSSGSPPHSPLQCMRLQYTSHVSPVSQAWYWAIVPPMEGKSGLFSSQLRASARSTIWLPNLVALYRQEPSGATRSILPVKTVPVSSCMCLLCSLLGGECLESSGFGSMGRLPSESASQGAPGVVHWLLLAGATALVASAFLSVRPRLAGTSLALSSSSAFLAVGLTVAAVCLAVAVGMAVAVAGLVVVVAGLTVSAFAFLAEGASLRTTLALVTFVFFAIDSVCPLGALVVLGGLMDAVVAAMVV